jgi:hypothetical protein
MPANNFYRILFLFFCLNFNSNLFSQFAQQPPFAITIEPVVTGNTFGIHSFAFAQKNGKWLIIGGRTNGLHGLNSNGPFDMADANNFITVIDTNGWQIYKSSLNMLAKSIADPLRSNNMAYAQVGDYLYMAGGYGRDSVINKFVTFPVVTKIRVDSMMDAVVNAVPVLPYIKQVSDTNLRICGGEMHYFNNKFYLMFGHDFNGRYANPFVPIYTQYYRCQVKKFDIVETAGVLSIANYSVVTDTNNFHRRDLNVAPIIKPGGAEALMAYGGVFQKGHDFPYFEPVLIDTNSYSVLPYTQVMSHYNCAHLPVYDSVSKKMHTVFFGGMSFNDYNPVGNTVAQDTGVPFISDVTCFTIKPGNLCEEAIMPLQLSGLLGSNAKFVPNTNLTWYNNGVLNINSLTGKTLAGYFLGGIRGQMANLGSSFANDTIFRIYIQPDADLSVKGVPDNFSFLDVYPNPASSKINLGFQLKNNSSISFSLMDLNGKELEKIESTLYKKGTNQLSFDVSKYSNGFYFIKAVCKEGLVSKRIVVQH